jgi:hypothetical protein
MVVSKRRRKYSEVKLIPDQEIGGFGKCRLRGRYYGRKEGITLKSVFCL